AEGNKRRIELRTGLSSIIDRGRWFFPNIKPLTIGVHKEGAYRGLRLPVLDYLVYAHNELEISGRTGTKDSNPDYDSVRQEILDLRRAFVAEIQSVLDPRKNSKMYLRHMNRHWWSLASSWRE
ncbi:MAG: hypothetical protein ACREDP_12750, partial [Bradyrhizobium sp.]